MNRDRQNSFYNSRSWRKCAKTYAESKQNLCERCFDKGIVKSYYIVHHKIYLTNETINNPDVSMNFENLEILCLDCHNLEHGICATKKELVRTGLEFDEKGNLIQIETSPHASQ
jgi:5-methylcytosine-specific restriction protein A